MTWATSVPILVFLGFSVLELGLMYMTDRQTDRHTDVRQTDVRQKHHLMYFTNVLVMHPWPYCNGHNRNDVMMIVMIVICDYDYDTNFTVDRI